MNIVFAQYSPETQDFFLKEYGQAHSLTVEKFPHYRFIKNAEDTYERYIKASWKTNNRVVLDKQLKKFKDVKDDIIKNGQRELIKVTCLDNGYMALIDGNHRYSVCAALGLDPKLEIIDFKTYISQLINCSGKYGANNGVPYQQVILNGSQLVSGRRNDIIERSQLLNINSESVLDLGCNLGIQLYLSNAKRKVGVDFNHDVLCAACRLNNIYTQDIIVNGAVLAPSSSSALYLGISPTALIALDTDGVIWSNTDSGTTDLGKSVRRFKDFYLGGKIDAGQGSYTYSGTTDKYAIVRSINWDAVTSGSGTDHVNKTTLDAALLSAFNAIATMWKDFYGG